jgi:hypothetical protein
MANEYFEQLYSSFTLLSDCIIEPQFSQVLNDCVNPADCANEEKNKELNFEEINFDNYDGLSSDGEVFSTTPQQQQYYSSAKNFCGTENKLCFFN